MKYFFKKTEREIKKLRAKPREEFREALAKKLLFNHSQFVEEKVEPWPLKNLLNLENMKSKKMYLGLSLVLVMSLVVGGSMLYPGTNKMFLNKAYAHYEQMIEDAYLAQKISLVSGPDFEEYLALFTPDNYENGSEDLLIGLTEYGRKSYIVETVTDENVELSYKEESPLLKIKVGNDWKYFLYSTENLSSGGDILNPWEEMLNMNTEIKGNSNLSLIDTLREDKNLIKIDSTNDSEMVFMRKHSKIELANGEQLFEKYYFDKNSKELLKKEEFTTYNDRDYILRVEKFEKFSDEDNFLFYEDENILSIAANQYYYAGGANGFSYFATLSYDKGSQKILTIDDIFVDTEAGLSALSDFAREELPKVLQAPDVEWIARGTASEANNYANYNFVHNNVGELSGLNIHFPEYQVSAGFEGSQTLFVPYDVFGELLK